MRSEDEGWEAGRGGGIGKMSDSRNSPTSTRIPTSLSSSSIDLRWSDRAAPRGTRLSAPFVDKHKNKRASHAAWQHHMTFSVITVLFHRALLLRLPSMPSTPSRSHALLRPGLAPPTSPPPEPCSSRPRAVAQQFYLPWLRHGRVERHHKRSGSSRATGSGDRVRALAQASAVRVCVCDVLAPAELRVSQRLTPRVAGLFSSGGVRLARIAATVR
ncbi:hypothetical protein F5883DRAFT_531330 [Diaporthe sp. PMI_573]|nr:hypothetical protein F5883DRAFT_531330 [Diaporthaceae sp. PMI_573]